MLFTSIDMSYCQRRKKRLTFTELIVHKSSADAVLMQVEHGLVTTCLMLLYASMLSYAAAIFECGWMLRSGTGGGGECGWGQLTILRPTVITYVICGLLQIDQKPQHWLYTRRPLADPITSAVDLTLRVVDMLAKVTDLCSEVPYRRSGRIRPTWSPR